MDPVMTLVAVVAVVALAVFAYGLVAAWRKVMRDGAPLPLHGMLRQKGVTSAEAGEQLGEESLANAARRCALCSSNEECQQRLAAGEPQPADCPNAAMFAGLTRPRA